MIAFMFGEGYVRVHVVKIETTHTFFIGFSNRIVGDFKHGLQTYRVEAGLYSTASLIGLNENR